MYCVVSCFGVKCLYLILSTRHIRHEQARAVRHTAVRDHKRVAGVFFFFLDRSCKGNEHSRTKKAVAVSFVHFSLTITLDLR